MKAYKGFKRDMTCSPNGNTFQYKEGETYETDEASLCRKGFHACENPLDCFAYYGPANSVFHEVELDANEETQLEDTKRVGKKIRIGARLSIAKMIDLSVAYIKEHLTDDAKSNTGDCSAATNTGNYSAATNTGDCSAATNTGDCSAATNTGDCSAATNTGDYSAATNTGDYSAATNAGDCSAATNTGDCSAATNTGNCSAATNTGKGGVALVTGYKGKAKGAVGSAICVCERGEWNGNEYPLLAIIAAIVDGETIKGDTWYICKNGQLVEEVEI